MLKFAASIAIVGMMFFASSVEESVAQEVVTWYAPSPSISVVPVRRGLLGLRSGYVPVVTGTVQIPVATTYAPAPMAYLPTTTLYAPAAPVTNWYAPTPVMTYPAPVPVTTFYAPRPLRVNTYYPPAVIIGR